MPEWTGRLLSKVEVGEHIGQGGMADVFLGRHTGLNRPVAVKILHAYLAGNEDLTERFVAEAQAVAGLRHPHIVQVFDFDVAEGQPYIVMELLDGMSLSEYLSQREGRLSSDVVLRLIGELGSALDYAHQRGIVHRDVKPSNVMLRADGGVIDANGVLPSSVQTVLTDFGIARISEASEQTASGTIIGTPGYMSPEQIRGEKIDSRSDVYSLGVVLYELLAGRLPFVGESQASVLIKHMTEPPPPLEGVSPEVQRVVDRALAKDRDDRFQTAAELSAALEQAFTTEANSDDTIMSAAPALATKEPDSPDLHAPGASPAPQVGGRDDGNTRYLRRAIVVGSVIVVVVTGLIVAMLVASGDDVPDEVGSTTTTAEDIPATSLPGSAGGTAANTAPTTVPPLDLAIPRGRVNFLDQTVEISISGMQPPPEGTEYHAWLLGPDTDTRRLGTLAPGVQEVSFAVSDIGSLLAAFNALVVTAEPVGFADQTPSSKVVFTAEIDSEVNAALKTMYTFTRIGTLAYAELLLPGAASQAAVHDDHVTFGLAAINDSDLRLAKRHSEHIVNLIVGEASADFADWDLNTLVENPGDAVGLMPYLTLIHASAQAVLQDQSSDTDERATAGRMVDSAAELLRLATNNVDIAKSLISADEVSETVKAFGDTLDNNRMVDALAALIAESATVTLTIDAPLMRAAP